MDLPFKRWGIALDCAANSEQSFKNHEWMRMGPFLMTISHKLAGEICGCGYMVGHTFGAATLAYDLLHSLSAVCTLQHKLLP
jgi:hypothetical protein